MANIADTAGIFVGPVLDAFNQMEFLVGRDGDVAFAQKLMLEEMQKVISITQPASAAQTGQTTKQRNK